MFKCWRAICFYFRQITACCAKRRILVQNVPILHWKNTVSYRFWIKTYRGEWSTIRLRTTELSYLVSILIGGLVAGLLLSPGGERCGGGPLFTPIGARLGGLEKGVCQAFHIDWLGYAVKIAFSVILLLITKCFRPSLPQPTSECCSHLSPPLSDLRGLSLTMGLVSVRVVVSVILPLIERLTNVVRAGRGYYNLGFKVTATIKSF